MPTHQINLNPNPNLRIARLLMVGLFVCYTWSVQAQKIELGVSGGGMLYKGDVATHLNPRFYRPAGGLFFRYNATRSLSLRFGAAMGSVQAEDRLARDPMQVARNFSFRSQLGELSADVEYNFFNYSDLPKAQNWTPYVFGGISVFNCRNNVIRARGMVGFPLGFGVKYEFRRPWSIGVEAGTRFTRFDYMDGLGNRTFTFNTNKTGQGNSVLSDSYTYTALTLSYTFYKIVCRN